MIRDVTHGSMTENDVCESPLLRERIAVTGMGICSSIGNSVDEVVTSLRKGKSNADRITRFATDPFVTQMAAEVQLDPESLPRMEVRQEWDRGLLMAVIASRQALRQSGLLSRDASVRVGVATGVSGSGQFQTARASLDRCLAKNARAAEVIFDKNVPSYQAEQVATHYELNGPQTTVVSASAGSGIAIGIAMRWLQSGRCDAVLAGGSECLSVLNIIGFDVLGITSKDRCKPFSDSDGMMMGEGAGYLLLERESSAQRRHASIVGYAEGFAVSADAFDPVMFDPTGGGQLRALRRALSDGNVTPDEVDWFRASGSGGKDQDSAELLAIKELFGDQTPPVTSLEPFFGHCNGAGPAIGLIAALACMERGILPPTLNFESPAANEPIDFVPNVARTQTGTRTLCNSAAFGGTNVAIVCSRSATSRLSRRTNDVWITGVGSLSAMGLGGRELFGRFREPQTGIAENDRFEMPTNVAPLCGLVRDFKPRRILPQINLRGVDLLAQYAAAASHLAWRDADLEPGRCDPDRLGVVAGLAYASGANLERLMHGIYQGFRRPTVGKLMLRNGRFMVTSQLACWFALQGYNSTLSSGELSGLHALCTAADQLIHDDRLDAILVVASDEVNPMFTELYDHSNLLVRPSGRMVPHSRESTGRMIGEGAVALILERGEYARRRGASALARVAGHSLGFHVQDRETAFDALIGRAISDANVNASDLTSVSGLGTGKWIHDRIECESLCRVLGTDQTPATLTGHTGFMESSGSLFSTLIAIGAVSDGRVPMTLGVDSEGTASVRGNLGDLPVASGPSLVVGHGRAGHQAAVVLAPATE